MHPSSAPIASVLRRCRVGAAALGLLASAGLAACSDPAPAVRPADSGLADVAPDAADVGVDTPVVADRGPDVPAGMDVVEANGPPPVPNPNVHMAGSAAMGRDVFRLETFGNEGFWTDVLRLPQGMMAAGFTPVQALRAGLSVDIDAVPPSLRATLAAELMTDLSPANAPTLNNPATTAALLNANALIGLVARDTTANGTVDIAAGDKVGVSCALCHAVTDGSVFGMPMGGSVGRRVDGPTPHALRVGSTFALAANSRGLYPLLQLALAANGGATIGRAPTGITETSTEAEVDAYLTNPAFYPVGMFDDGPDGNGAPVHIAPAFRADLAAPWGSEGGVSRLDDFSNRFYTVLLDPTRLLTPGGRAFLRARVGAAGDEIADDYAMVLAATGSPTGPFVQTAATTGTPGTEATPAGVRVDNARLLDLNAYLNSLQAPPGADVDPVAAAAGRALFRRACTGCHHVDQSILVPPMIVPVASVWPGYAPMVLAMRAVPLSPIQNSPGFFDDKMVVFDASHRMLPRGVALPLLLDLARRPALLHDGSVPTLDALLDPARGATSPHPFYLSTAAERASMVAFLRSLTTGP